MSLKSVLNMRDAHQLKKRIHLIITKLIVRVFGLVLRGKRFSKVKISEIELVNYSKNFLILKTFKLIPFSREDLL